MIKAIIFDLAGVIFDNTRGFEKELESILKIDKEKLVVIQVGEKQLLIGVTPSSINTLHTLEIPLELDSAPELFSNALE